MIVVIQCAARKQPDAGLLHTRDGHPVFFVAAPGCAHNSGSLIYAHPDEPSDSGPSWRELLVEYNDNPGENPLGLYPAYALYHNPTYKRLVDRFGLDKVFILSAGWGLIPASFLTPTYDITFSTTADAYKRRRKKDVFRDFSMLPENCEEEIYYFGGKNYIPQFCRLTTRHRGERIVFYNSAIQPQAPGCVLRRFETRTRTNWHYECANAFVSGDSRIDLGAQSTVSSRAQSGGSVAMKTRLNAPRPLPREQLILHDDEVRSAIRKSRKGITQYLWLMRKFHTVNVSQDREFQRRYNAFYRVRQRSADWYSAYYQLLEASKETGTDFSQVLDALWDRLGRYEPSFSSKLVATIDPTKPVWDQFVLTNTGLKDPSYADSRKIEKAKIVYQLICDWYSPYLVSGPGRRIIDIFDREVTPHKEIADIKKVDFVLWQTRGGK